jgi:trehalose 6-phosphate synthase/phosphatase
MPGNNYNGSSSRVTRLLRQRELRKSNKTSHSNEANDNNSRGSESFEPELRLREEENGSLEGARVISEGCEKLDGNPDRQRLLVVANRLPVSAVRRGEDSWSLEISAGGLVSALLGK